MTVSALQFSSEQLAEVRRLQGLYPDRRGALLPVLHMAQVDDRYELNLTPDKVDRLLEGLR